MNGEMKQLIEILNNAGYEVIEFGDMNYGGVPYKNSGQYFLKVSHESKCLSHNQISEQCAEVHP